MSQCPKIFLFPKQQFPLTTEEEIKQITLHFDQEFLSFISVWGLERKTKNDFCFLYMTKNVAIHSDYGLIVLEDLKAVNVQYTGGGGGGGGAEGGRRGGWSDVGLLPPHYSPLHQGFPTACNWREKSSAERREGEKRLLFFFFKSNWLSTLPPSGDSPWKRTKKTKHQPGKGALNMIFTPQQKTMSLTF